VSPPTRRSACEVEARRANELVPCLGDDFCDGLAKIWLVFHDQDRERAISVPLLHRGEVEESDSVHKSSSVYPHDATANSHVSKQI
jgi:hypothetical protein